MVKRALALSLLILSCAIPPTVEKEKIDGCLVENYPDGNLGAVKVSCEGLEFWMVYDTDPDGRDPFIRGFSKVKAKRLSTERIDPYEYETGDSELLEGWAFKEVWQVGDAKVRGFEFFVHGGSSCYEWEEGGEAILEWKGKRIRFLRIYDEGTECGGS